MTMRNLMIAMMILIVLGTVTVIVSAANRPTATVKIPYRTSTASVPTMRAVPAPVVILTEGSLHERSTAPGQSPDN